MYNMVRPGICSTMDKKEKTCQRNVSVAGVQDFEEDFNLFFILISFILIISVVENP